MLGRGYDSGSFRDGCGGRISDTFLLKNAFYMEHHFFSHCLTLQSTALGFGERVCLAMKSWLW